MKKLYLIAFAVFFVQAFSQKNEEAERKSMIRNELQKYSKMVDYNVNPNTLNYDLKYQRLELDLDPASTFRERNGYQPFRSKSEYFKHLF
ncbi:hypothetical protein LDL59_06800 [Kaistella anthropi]|nr:hypothetical protein [Kaistella anthropi]